MVWTLKRLAAARVRELTSEPLQLPPLRKMPGLPEDLRMAYVQLKKTTTRLTAERLFRSATAVGYEYSVELESILQSAKLVPYLPDGEGITANPGTVRQSVESLVLAGCVRFNELNEDVTQVTRWLARERELRGGDLEQNKVFELDPENQKVSEAEALEFLLDGIREWCIEFRVNVLLLTGDECDKLILILGEEVFDSRHGLAFPLALRQYVSQEGKALFLQALRPVQRENIDQPGPPVETQMTTGELKRKADDMQAVGAVSSTQVQDTDTEQAQASRASASQVVSQPPLPLPAAHDEADVIASASSISVPWMQPLENIEYGFHGETHEVFVDVRKYTQADEPVRMSVEKYRECRRLCGAFVETSEYNVPLQTKGGAPEGLVFFGDDDVCVQSTFGVANDGVGGSNGPKTDMFEYIKQHGHPARDKAQYLREWITYQAIQFAEDRLAQKNYLEREPKQNVAMDIMYKALMMANTMAPTDRIYDWNRYGSTTSTLAVLERNQLHIVTLGDSQICVMVPDKPYVRGSFSTYKCEYLSQPRYYSKEPPPPIQVGLKNPTPESEVLKNLNVYSDHTIITVPEGAIVLGGSDGLFENLIGCIRPSDVVAEPHRRYNTNSDAVENAKKAALESFFNVGHSHMKTFADALWRQVREFMWNPLEQAKPDDCGFWMSRVSFLLPPIDPFDGDGYSGWEEHSNHYSQKQVIPLNIKPPTTRAQVENTRRFKEEKARLNVGYAKHVRFRGPKIHEPATTC
mmetsp:Transcript_33627/g.53936  ORF Transcript_33627/g.53936 Transcript_33627/m.53936 type:complete len:749 (-) Transcript_33627:792-3038(-)